MSRSGTGSSRISFGAVDTFENNPLLRLFCRFEARSADDDRFGPLRSVSLTATEYGEFAKIGGRATELSSVWPDLEKDVVVTEALVCKS